MSCATHIIDYHIYLLSPKTAEFGNYRIKNYSPEDYGGHPQNWGICQDEKTGMMYFATGSYVMQFDGKNWGQYQIGPGYGAVAIDSQGTVYAGGTSEISYLHTDERGQKTILSLADKLPKDHKLDPAIWRIATTSHGVYFKERSNILRLFEDSVQIIPCPKQRLFYQIGDEIFIYDGKSIQLMQGDQFIQLPHTEQVGDASQPFTHVLPAPNGNLFFISLNGNLYLYEYSKIKQEGSFDPSRFNKSILKEVPTTLGAYLKKYRAYCTTRLNENQYAIGTLGGGIVIVDIDGNLVNIINKSRGLIDNRVYYVFTDKDQNLWAATNNSISQIYTSWPFQYFDNVNGLTSGTLDAIRYKNTLYTATFSDLYYLPDYELQLEKDVHTFTKILNSSIWDFEIYQDALFGAGRQSLYQIKGTETKELFTAPKFLYSIGHSKQLPNHLFIGSAKGMSVVKLKKGADGWFTAEEVYQDEFKDYPYSFRAIVSDKDGDVWATSSNSGLLHIKINDDETKSISSSILDTLSGLPSNSGNYVSIYQNELLIASRNGFYELDGTNKDKFVHSTRLTGLPDKRIVHDIAYENNKVFVAGDHTAASFDLSKENASWNLTPFTGLDGTLIKLYLDTDGVIWYASSKNLSRYDSKNTKNYTAPYQTIIKQVNLHSDSTIYFGNATTNMVGLSEENEVVLTYENNNIKFEYAAIFFEENEQLEYQYQLKGFDEEFSNWSLENKKEYGNLPEGKYCFQVRSKNIYGHQSEVASYYFTVQAPWYRTLPAYFLYLVSMIGLVYGIVKLYTRRLKQQNKKLEQIVSDRTAEVVAQNEELYQQQEEILAQRDHIQEQKEQIERSYNNINVLSNIGREITSTLQTKEIIKMVYGHINQLMKAEAFGIGIYDPVNKSIDFEGFIENEEEIPFSSDDLSNENLLSVHCFLNKKDIIINDYEQEYSK